jgi:hypothetical protein
VGPKLLLTILMGLVVGVPQAWAVTVEITLPPGPQLQQLARLCNLRKVELNNPGLTNDQCARQLLIMGARWYSDQKVREAGRTALMDSIVLDREQIKTDLPLPTAIPTPTPSPTATPTATPTTTPTAP